MKENQNKDWNSYIKYSAMGFQMLATIGVFAFIGYKIDEKRKSDTPIFTAILSLLGTIAALYQVIRSLGKK